MRVACSRTRSISRSTRERRTSSADAACELPRDSEPAAERAAALQLVLARQETCEVGADRERGDRVAHERIPDRDRLRAEGRDVGGEGEEHEAEHGEHHHDDERAMAYEEIVLSFSRCHFT